MNELLRAIYEAALDQPNPSNALKNAIADYEASRKRLANSQTARCMDCGSIQPVLVGGQVVKTHRAPDGDYHAARKADYRDVVVVHAARGTLLERMADMTIDALPVDLKG